jgi:uncharacterized protein (TIGR00297 family)
LAASDAVDTAANIMTAAPLFSEDKRQALHMSMGAFALSLRYLPWWIAAIVAGGAVAFNAFWLPRLAGARILRPSEAAGGYPPGILFYPISVVLLILIFPDRPDIAAAAWGIMAFGDGAATFVGRRVGGRRIPWNTAKTVAGSLAFIAAGGAAGAFLAWWCCAAVIPPPYWWFTLLAPVMAAVTAAVVETLPIRLDDNITVPASAAAILWAVSLISEDLLAAVPALTIASLPWAVGVNVVAGGLGYRARTVSASGTVTGAVIGIIIFVCAGWQGWLLLFTAFAVAAVTSRVGWRRKAALGIAEERGGRRGAGNAIANTGVAAGAAILAVLSYAHDTALVAFVAALTAGGSDTIASEIGKAWGRRTYLITDLRAVPAGTSGALSIEGTIAGFAGALALAALGVLLGLAPAWAIPAIVGGAAAGSIAESVMGATLEPRGIVNNDVLNFLNTTIAALAAILLIGAAA